MDNIKAKVDEALQQLLSCLHPKDSQWLSNQVQQHALLSEFESLLDQEELEISRISQLVTRHTDLQAYFDLLSPATPVSDALRNSLRRHLLTQANTLMQDEIHADRNH
ncbi:hypothetical protein [Gynuella sunshinyii]|uniref:Uncharacterized protein n=1 Tax=Gynuella sunshinyii YC6258 TaxID=1445510 RepID=A0A0C5UZI8_9GAMM|nr:hypothetical protein [Gynuella sunshinyii]AJQ92715.1 hypothetical Protein YC6258_00665 [Gynuella sunshinyii YC6258]